MGRPARKLAPAQKKEAPKKAASGHARRKTPGKRQEPAVVYAAYHRILDRLLGRLSGSFSENIKQAVQTHDEMAVDSYLLWRLARHPQVRQYAMAEIGQRYTTIDSRHFAAWIMDHVRDIDEQYIRRFRVLLQSAFERLDYLANTGQWAVLEIRSQGSTEAISAAVSRLREQIRDKIRELGGGDPTHGMANLHRSWQSQRRTSIRQTVEQQEIDEAKRRGWDVATYRGFLETQRAARRNTRYDREFRQFAADMIEKGERVETWRGDGVYVEREGVRVRLSQQELEPIIWFWRRHRAEERRRRATADAS